MGSRRMQAEALLDAGMGKRLAEVELPPAADGRDRVIPLGVITGARGGPTVWINAALHGDEYLGAAAVARLLQDLEPEAVRGRLVLTPTLNPGGLVAMQRVDPANPADFNRVWSPEGVEATEPVAAWAGTVLLARSDYVLDLHSGGNRFLQQSYAVYSCVGGRVDEASSAFAKACGTPWIWAHRRSILEAGLITAASSRGKPAVLVEIAGEGKAEPAWVDEMTGAIRGALAHVGLLAERPKFRSSYRVFEGFTVVLNREAGLWERSRDPGGNVGRGDPLGRVLDLLGRELEVVRSPVDAAVAGICTYGYVPAQDYVAELAHEFHDEGPPG